jgi:hypothetical protein
VPIGQGGNSSLDSLLEVQRHRIDGDAVSIVLPIDADRDARPFGRRVAAGLIGQHITMVVGVNTGNDDAGLVGFVAEVNNGGAMVEATLRVVDANVSCKAVHASRGKVVRAQPVAALYELSRIHHVGAFPALEDQMCAFTTDFDRAAAGFSPDSFIVDSKVS